MRCTCMGTLLYSAVHLAVTTAAAVTVAVDPVLEPGSHRRTQSQVQHHVQRVLEVTLGARGGFVEEDEHMRHNASVVPGETGSRSGLIRRAAGDAGDAGQLHYIGEQRELQSSSLEEVFNSTDDISSGVQNASNETQTNVSSKKQMSAIVPTILSFAVLVLFLASQIDFISSDVPDPAERPASGLAEEAVARAAASAAAAASEPLPDADTGGTAIIQQRPERGILVILVMTCYKFYIGFLNGTFVPFLVAKEGVAMTLDRQSLFMGVIKLIYGFSMFMNPALGLISDKLAEGSVRHGRSVFMLTGVLMEGIALVAAKLASDNKEMGCYIAACVTWMLGEAFSDVVVEALPLELLPPTQYNLASSIRSLHFFGGALSGYTALFFLHRYSYDWLYYAYLGLMLSVAVPTLVMARYALSTGPAAARDLQEGQRPPRVGIRVLLSSYITPMLYPGYFPPAVAATFIFCLGTPPLYFTLLMVRDLVGITDESEQQKQFSGISILFLSCAVLSAACTGTSDSAESIIGPEEVGQIGDAADSAEPSGRDAASSSSAAIGAGVSLDPPGVDAGFAEAASGAAVASRVGSEGEAVMWTLLALWAAMYGILCCAAPAVAVPADVHGRLVGLYVISGFFGLTFGSVYSRFKSCTWITLPPGADVANAMGVASVGQITGTGIGNFIAACILDAFGTHGKSQYGVKGYVVVSWCCSVAVFSAIVLLVRIMMKRGMQRPSIRKLLLW